MLNAMLNAMICNVKATTHHSVHVVVDPPEDVSACTSQSGQSRETEAEVHGRHVCVPAVSMK